MLLKTIVISLLCTISTLCFADGGNFAPSPLPPTSLMEDFLKTALALIFIVALIYLVINKGLAKLIKKNQQGKYIKIIERISLDTKNSLAVMEVQKRQYIIGVSDGNISLLKEIETNSANNNKLAFNNLLNSGVAKSSSSPRSEIAA